MTSRLRIALAAVATLGAVAMPLWPRSPVVPHRDELTFEHVTLVTPGLSRIENQRLVVERGRIAAIEASADLGTARRYVLPGLVDMHVHLPPRLAPGLVDFFGLLFLVHGVTSIRDVGSLDGQGLEIASQIEAGERLGPRTFTCGRILDGDPPTFPVARVLRTGGEGEAAVRSLAARGASCVKTYEGISAPALSGVTRAAKASRLPVVGHIPSALSLADQPLDDVQHVCYPRCESSSPEEIEAFVHASAVRGTAHTPTLVAFEGQMLLASPDADGTRVRPYDLMPRFWREILWRPFVRNPNPDALRAMQELVRRLHALGVRIHAGTDPVQPFVVPGASLHRELELLVGAGLSTDEALAAATWVAGDSLGVAGLGRLEVGAPADLLVLREDPTRGLDALGTIEHVIAGGRAYPIETLQAELERARRYFERPIVDLSFRAVARLGFEIVRRSLDRDGAEAER